MFSSRRSAFSRTAISKYVLLRAKGLLSPSHRPQRRGRGFVYVQDEGAEELAFMHPAIAEYGGKCFMHKHPKGEDFPHDCFPNAVIPSDAESESESDTEFANLQPRKALSFQIVAYCGAIVRLRVCPLRSAR